ncbi:MAG: NAD-binding protein [Holdemania massiliensis]
MQADFTDIDQLRAIGIQDCDAAVVATGSHLEESIMGVMNLGAWHSVYYGQGEK